MTNFESRFQRVWGLLSDRFTTPNRVVLGVCAFVSQKFGLPVVALRVIGLVLLCFYPLTCLIIYLIASFFVEESTDLQ